MSVDARRNIAGALIWYAILYVLEFIGIGFGGGFRNITHFKYALLSQWSFGLSGILYLGSIFFILSKNEIGRKMIFASIFFLLVTFFS